MTYKALEDVAETKGYNREMLAESIGLTYNQLTKRILLVLISSSKYGKDSIHLQNARHSGRR